MSKDQTLQEIPLLPKEITDAALDGNLIFFVGSGVSIIYLPGLVWLSKH